MIIKEPQSIQEFKKYYNLRWRALREPWGQPEGSEKDELEANCFHIMVLEGDDVIGVGRGHFNSPDEYQVRYMAVAENWRSRGVGTMILNNLEDQASKSGAKQIMLHARENAVEFYQKRGYRVVKPAHTLFGSIKHFEMIKQI